ncbi:hypothetical protein AR275_32285 [Stenotrophomonas maltophilia]|nr:hypothetical protein AR275_32285 [Stenotrophomonas maltophilia]
MFVDACAALAEVSRELGCDPEQGGAEPILAAIAELREALAARQPVGISAEWVLGYLTTDAPEESHEAIRNAFAEYAALSAARQPVDSCTESECKRCRAHPDHSGSMEHAGISDFRQPVGEPVAYLDLGAGGYMDVGTDLSDEELAVLPKGRHMLGIIGTYGVDGYKPAQAVDLGELRKMLDGWKNSDYPFSYEGQCAQRALDACVADLQGWIDSQAAGNG